MFQACKVQGNFARIANIHAVTLPPIDRADGHAVFLRKLADDFEARIFEEWHGDTKFLMSNCCRFSDAGNGIFPDVFQLLQDYQGQAVSGWFMSSKLDGFRCGWTGQDFILRGGGVLRVPGWWKAGMPTTALDGELFAGVGNLYSIQGRIRDGFHGLSFQTLDAPAVAGSFRQRLAVLRGLSLPNHVGIVEQIRCRDTKHLVEFADAIVAAGGEGAVVRCPKAIYREGRTGSVLRWVPQDPALNRRRVAA